jgi:superfamily II DNA or RNA helicase
MKGLYLLSGKLLQSVGTVKFGMSMRLEHRWQDYLAVFGDAHYIYYYELVDELTREDIIRIEGRIINIHIEKRNHAFQTEYFLCDSYVSFHQTVIDTLQKHKIKYIVHDKHIFNMTNYDNKPEPFYPHKFDNLSDDSSCDSSSDSSDNSSSDSSDNSSSDSSSDSSNDSSSDSSSDSDDDIIKLTRYGQQDVLNKFKDVLKNKTYWGVMIAPTGWGKTLMHNIFFGEYLKHGKKNAMLITKKKDLLNDIGINIHKNIEVLKKSGFYDKIPHIENCVKNAFDSVKINKCNNSIIIINIDKLINKQDNESLLKKVKLIDWKKIGFIIFDEVHHIGTNCVYEIMNYVKNVGGVNYCIGSSATPVRNNFDNQNNIRKLFNKSEFKYLKHSEELCKSDINILHEISYKEAWDNKIILPIKIEIITLNNTNIIIDNSTKKFIGWKYSADDRQKIKTKITNILGKSYRRKIIFYTTDRLSCLDWYVYLCGSDNKSEIYNNYSKYISFSSSGSDVTEPENKTDNKTNRLLNIKINKKIKNIGLTKYDLENGITKFKNEPKNSFLFVVGRATEGYDDKPLDIVFNLDPVIDRSVLLELQKMGRTTRVFEKKQTGYYVVPIIKVDEYTNNIGKFMADYIRAMIKPILDKKNNEIVPQTASYYQDIAMQIFNVDEISKINGFVEIEHQQLYDTLINYLYPTITYKQAIQIIRNNKYKPNNIEEYYNLCKTDARLSLEPDKIYDKFNWAEYLSIERKYYNLETCKDMVKTLLKNHPWLHMIRPSETCVNLCKLDSNFPPAGIWTHYYNVQISEIIKDKPSNAATKKMVITNVKKYKGQS